MSTPPPSASTNDAKGFTATELRFLAAALVHDARNPLNSLVIHTELLTSVAEKRPHEVPAILSRTLAAFEREIERLTAILDRYAETVGPPSADAVPLELVPLVEEAVARGGGDGSALVTAPSVEAGLAPIQAEPAAIPVALDNVLRYARSVHRAPTPIAVAVLSIPEAEMVAVEIAYQDPSVDEDALPHLFRVGEGGRACALSVAKQAAVASGGAATVRLVGPRVVIRLAWPRAAGEAARCGS